MTFFVLLYIFLSACLLAWLTYRYGEKPEDPSLLDEWGFYVVPKRQARKNRRALKRAILYTRWAAHAKRKMKGIGERPKKATTRYPRRRNEDCNRADQHQNW